MATARSDELEKLQGITDKIRAAQLGIFMLSPGAEMNEVFVKLGEIEGLLWMRASELAGGADAANKILGIGAIPSEIRKLTNAGILEKNPDFLRENCLIVSGDYFIAKPGAPAGVTARMIAEIQRLEAEAGEI